MIVELVSPEGILYKDEAKKILPTIYDGRIGILNRHINYISLLGTGKLVIYDKNGKEHKFAISKGFIEVNKDKVIICPEWAIKGEGLIKEEIEKERKELEEKLKQDLAGKQRQEIEKKLLQTIAKLKALK